MTTTQIPEITPFDIAMRFNGLTEIRGKMNDPIIMQMLNLDVDWPTADETPWCSAFMNYIIHLYNCISPMQKNLPRTGAITWTGVNKSLMARSWLHIGNETQLDRAYPGYDVVVLKRGAGNQPGPHVYDAPGHVGFFAGLTDDRKAVKVLGGNQSNMVRVSSYDTDRVLGVMHLIY